MSNEQNKRTAPVSGGPAQVDFDFFQWVKIDEKRAEEARREVQHIDPAEAEERRMEHAEYTRERLRLDCMEFTDGEEDE